MKRCHQSHRKGLGLWCEHGAFVIPMAGGAAKTVEGANEAEVGVGWGGGAVTGWATNVGFTGWKVGLTEGLGEVPGTEGAAELGGNCSEEVELNLRHSGGEVLIFRPGVGI